MRNPTFEQALTKQGVKWTYVEALPVKDIDRNRSLANQARLEQAIVPELVEAYRAAYREGDEFPPLVVHRPGRGKYVILDGNQRFCAMSPIPGWRGLATHDAYVVESTNQKVLDRIAWTFNNHVNGRRLSYEESMQHAITFVRRDGMSCKEAAHECGVREDALEKNIRIEKAKDILREQNVRRMPVDSMLERLIPLRTLGEDVFAETTRVVTETGAGWDEVTGLIRQVRRAKTHREKMDLITRFEQSEEIQEKKAASKGGTVKVRPPQMAELLQRNASKVRGILQTYMNKKSTLQFSLKADKLRALETARDIVRLFTLLYGPEVLSEVQEAV